MKREIYSGCVGLCTNWAEKGQRGQKKVSNPRDRKKEMKKVELKSRLETTKKWRKKEAKTKSILTKTYRNLQAIKKWVL